MKEDAKEDNLTCEKVGHLLILGRLVAFENLTHEDLQEYSMFR